MNVTNFSFVPNSSTQFHGLPLLGRNPIVTLSVIKDFYLHLVRPRFADSFESVLVLPVS